MNCLQRNVHRIAALRVVCLVAIVAMARAAQADAIVLKRGGRVENITIRSIANAQIVFIDNDGKARRQALDGVRSISFAAISELDDAMAARDQADHARAIDLLLRSYVRATAKAQQLWIRAMLAEAHSAAGQYVEAASHAATVFAMDDHEYWRRLVPRGRVNEPPYAATAEAMHSLTVADATVGSQRLATAIDQMIGAITPVHSRASRDHSGPAFEAGTTLSGVSIDAIRQRLDASTSRPPDQDLQPNELPVRPDEHAAADDRTSSSPRSDSPDAIDRLLDRDQFKAALDACRRVGTKPGNRDLSRLLFQYGRSYRGAGQPRDALVMFVRCAVLYPDSVDAPAALMETAFIYRDVIGQTDTARRLLERARAVASMLGQESQVRRATRELDAIQ